MSFFNHSRECAIWFMFKIKKEKLNSWHKDRKRTYLLKHNIKSPLSIDDAIWDDFDRRHCEFQSIGVVLHPDYQLSEDYTTLLMTIFAEDYRHLMGIFKRSNLYWPTWLQCLNQDRVNMNFLGYDVADFMLISGMNNCGYANDEKKLLEVYSPFINENGLISDLEAARSIKKLTDKRVPEHAPFYIFGIYEVKAKLKS